MSCEETREHLESCEDCRLHVVVEARLRTQQVLEPPKGLVDRVMKSLPRAVPLRRELARLAAAAAILVAIVAGALAFGLDRHEKALEARQKGDRMFRATVNTLNPMRSELWKR